MSVQYCRVASDQDIKKALLTPLDEQKYEKAEVPSASDVREALMKGASDLRNTAEQPKHAKVDPKLRFR